MLSTLDILSIALSTTCPLRPQYVHTLWAPPGVRVCRPSFHVHGWFLSVRASEALSHQSFAIPRSLKAANFTLRASSYLRNSGGRNLRHHSSASSAPVAVSRYNQIILVLPPKKYMAGLLYISKTRGPHTYNLKPTASMTKYAHLPVLYPTPTPPEDTGYQNILVGTPAHHVLYPLNL
ncbi:hypothetical protein M9H77_21639 [Catharanthus roseus]|uniref:Uncharacterized protein n=1 Tax=Catharanthus roseus TaxID=4058 RepID=A0ACC0ANX1_CATRO|nr:hypothetical protein M9H77_21639 [Catharanthus roseus]